MVTDVSGGAMRVVKKIRIESLPLLDLVEALEERDGDEDDDGLLAVADFKLY